MLNVADFHRDIYYANINMVKGGWNGQPEKKLKLGVREKNKKRERKKEENYIKNASFWAIISKKNSQGGLPTPR